MKNKKAVVAMSGGVDSSVAAKLLKDQDFELTGIFLHFWKDEKIAENLFDQAENKCCSIEALMDARKVCHKIGMPLYTLNFKDAFREEIVEYFLNEYRIGNTPNPCVRCNKFVKLGLLIKKAQELGFDYVASGHYVRLKKVKDKIKLFRAKDKNKDQSYFLYALSQEQLSHLLFPLGDYIKSDVREIAKKAELPVATKTESQEICFIPGKSHNEFLKRYINLKPGQIKTMEGEIVGEHKGLPLYTIGQRKGVEIGGIGPFYVAKTDYDTNTLYVVNDANDPILFSNELIAKNVNWISGEEPRVPLSCEAVIRYRHKAAKCVITKKSEKEYLVKFDEPQRAITSGQSVVFYQGEEVLGGGIIG